MPFGIRSPSCNDNYTARRSGGSVALFESERTESRFGGSSDRLRELGERDGDPQVPDCFDSEFVVAAAQVLHEGEPRDDDRGGAVRS